METNGNGHEKQNGSGVFALDVDEVLTRDALNEKRKYVVELLETKAKVESEKASTVHHFKLQLETLEEKISETLLVIRAGRERAMVECREIFDLERATATTVRLDTGELVSERAMDVEELAKRRQQPLL